MQLPKTLLVPTDFSAPSEQALDYAILLAQKLEGTVHVVHVYQHPELLWPDSSAIVTAETIQQIEKVSRKALADLVARKQAEGVHLEAHLKFGDPRASLEAVAAELHADLICMGTHGRRGLTRLLLGSVAEYTVRTSKIPVLTVRANAG
jgi:nucleotide-binding universal stress UspA family protein